MEPLTMDEVLVTPELAAEWLNHNTRNREKRPKRIAAYARDMAAGRWRRSGEAIKFAPDGTLLDGQNRHPAPRRPQRVRPRRRPGRRSRSDVTRLLLAVFGRDRLSLTVEARRREALARVTARAQHPAGGAT